MATYVIAKKRGNEDAKGRAPGAADLPEVVVPAIFTDHRVADGYLGRLEDKDLEVARLSATDLLRWMIRVHELGAHSLSVNPRSVATEEGKEESRLAIERQLAHFAELLTREVVACAESARGIAEAR